MAKKFIEKFFQQNTYLLKFASQTMVSQYSDGKIRGKKQKLRICLWLGLGLEPSLTSKNVIDRQSAASTILYQIS